MSITTIPRWTITRTRRARTPEVCALDAAHRTVTGTRIGLVAPITNPDCTRGWACHHCTMALVPTTVSAVPAPGRHRETSPECACEEQISWRRAAKWMTCEMNAAHVISKGDWVASWLIYGLRVGYLCVGCVQQHMLLYPPDA